MSKNAYMADVSPVSVTKHTRTSLTPNRQSLGTDTRRTKTLSPQLPQTVEAEDGMQQDVHVQSVMPPEGQRQTLPSILGQRKNITHAGKP